LKSKASAPCKVILFGEHFVVYGIKAILGSIEKRVTVTTTSTQEKDITIKSKLGEIKIPTSESYEKINSPLIPFVFLAKKFVDKFNHKGGLEVIVDSDIPSGVGLGTSSACCVAGAASISGLFTKYSKEEILKLAIEAEQTIFKETSGADCTVCTYGGIIEYGKKDGFRKISSESEFHLVIANSLVPHSTNKIVSKVKKFKEQNEEAFSSLCENESKLIEKVNHALANNDLVSLGQSMSENQRYLKQIGVSNEKLQSMIMLAEETAYGAKITGAGDGGCIIALTDDKNLNQTIDKLRSQNNECFSVKIDSKGLDTF